jgi:hypothetical protein
VPGKKEKLPLSVTHPELAKEADGWDANLITRGSRLKMKWVCVRGHKWEQEVRRRNEGSGNCPKCSSLPIEGVSDLLSKYPEIGVEAYGWDPKEIKPFSNLKKEWCCPEGHIWICTPAKRITDGTNCTVCSNYTIRKGINDLKSTHPDIALMASGWEPTDYKSGSGEKKSWQGTCGHKWTSRIADVANGSGCPYCTNKKVLAGFNDLETTHSNLCKEAVGWDPKTKTSGSNSRVLWECRFGHQWKSGIKQRAHQNSGCPICDGKVVLFGFNDLQTKAPKIAAEAHGWDPKLVTFASGKRFEWECSLGHIWIESVSGRTVGGRNNSGYGCPYCSGKRVLIGFNDLITIFPKIAEEASGWDPKLYTSGSSRKLKWRCTEGHYWVATISDRTGSHKSGCPTCSPGGGFDPNDQGYLYFLSHPHWAMFQIGITNVPNRRLSEHAKKGWELLELRGPMDGHLTQQWETAILRMLKAKGADLSNSKIAGKFDGYSEAWSKSTFKATSIANLMKLTDEFEEKR